LRRVIDELGKTYGRLTVVEAYDWRKHGYYCNVANAALWVCECECGETTIVAGASLRSGATKSCGCYRRERTRMQGLNQRGSKKPRKARGEK
jgi:hypothetical protein